MRHFADMDDATPDDLRPLAAGLLLRTLAFIAGAPLLLALAYVALLYGNDIVTAALTAISPGLAEARLGGGRSQVVSAVWIVLTTSAAFAALIGFQFRSLRRQGIAFLVLFPALIVAQSIPTTMLAIVLDWAREGRDSTIFNCVLMTAGVAAASCWIAAQKVNAAEGGIGFASDTSY